MNYSLPRAALRLHGYSHLSPFGLVGAGNCAFICVFALNGYPAINVIIFQ